MTHIPEPDRANEEHDQREFDERVRRNTPFMVTGIVALMALALSAVALAQSTRTVTAMPAAATAMNGSQMATRMTAATPVASTRSAAAPVEYLKVIPEYKLGSDGQKHDAFTQTEFHVKVGQPLTLRIDNTDTANHSITSPAAGVNITVTPGVHDYTLLVKTPGHFLWACMLACDEWAMHHVGYMSGYITAS